jgi:serine/threonine protein kinase
MSAPPDRDMDGTTPFDDTPTAELAPRTPLVAATRSIQVELGPGSVLRSRHVLEDVIGYGGTSIIFRARDLHRSLFQDEATNFVAVKLLRTEKRLDPLALVRLKREFWLMQRLSHPSIVRVFDLDCDDEVWFITMELVAGRTVRSLMETGCSVAGALKIIGACCEALEHAHRLGIVHGDLKPTNVMVADDGTAKLIDFGSASSAHRSVSSVSDPTLAATPSYASPQVLAGQSADRRDDIFSIACLSYVMLSRGRHPFGGRPPFECRTTSAPVFVRAIPIELFEVIERGLSADRERRPTSAGEFLSNLTDADRRRRANASGAAKPVRHNVHAERDAAFVMRIVDRAWRRMSRPLTALLAGVARSFTSLVRTATARRVLESIGQARNATSSQRAGPLLNWAVAVCLAVIGAAIVLRDRTHRVAVRTATSVPNPAVTSREAPMFQVIPRHSLLYISVPGLPALGDRDISTTVNVLTPAVSTPALITTAGAPSVVVPETRAEPHDFGVISFEGPTVHASALQPLVAISVVRRKATKSRGTFVWQVERGTAQPSVDYKSMKPQLVSFIEGQTVRMLFIPLIDRSEAGVVSGPRDFTVRLRQVAGGPSLGRYRRITVVIDPLTSARLRTGDGG